MSEATYIHGSSESELERLSKLNALTNRDFIDFLEIKPEEMIVELGSGPGILASLVSKELTKGKITGLEISQEQLKACPPAGKKLEFIQADVHKVPLQDSSYDKVYCRYILEHIADPSKVLNEAQRILKSGGKIYIQENSILLIVFHPSCPSFMRVWKKFATLQKKLGGDAMVGIKLFSLLEISGFKNIELSLQPEIHWYGKASFKPWINNLIGNIEGGASKLISQKLAQRKEINMAIDELEAFKHNPSASTYFYWNRAKAEK